MPNTADAAVCPVKNNPIPAAVPASPAVDGRYRYVPRNPLWRIVSFLLCRCILVPLARLWGVLRFRHRTVGREKLRGFRRRGCFLYGNRPAAMGIACLAGLFPYSKRTYVIVSAERVSRRSTRGLLRLCGAIPTPTTLSAYRNYLEAIEKRTVQKSAVAILPPQADERGEMFPDISHFTYPVRFDEPAFCFTTVLQTDACGRRRTVTYLDGPFYPRRELPRREQIADLHQRICAQMRERLSAGQASKDAEGRP